jgi:choline dehydrogenase-like flavoprotein
MVYTRGAASDYDRWANVTGDPGWSWDALQPYLRKVSNGLSGPRKEELTRNFVAREI